MALTYTDCVKIAADANFIGRVYYAMQLEASEVYTETPPPANHQQRATYAVKILNSNSVPQGTIMSILTSPTIVAEGDATKPPLYNIADIDILNYVGFMWNAWAGA
jgi:hypothetical protein